MKSEMNNLIEDEVKTDRAEPAVSPHRDSCVRYRVLALAVLLAAITYPDRVCISLTAPAMMRNLDLSKVQIFSKRKMWERKIS